MGMVTAGSSKCRSTNPSVEKAFRRTKRQEHPTVELNLACTANHSANCLRSNR